MNLIEIGKRFINTNKNIRKNMKKNTIWKEFTMDPF